MRKNIFTLFITYKFSWHVHYPFHRKLQCKMWRVTPLIKNIICRVDQLSMFSKRYLNNWFRVDVHFKWFAAKTFDRTVLVLIIKLLQLGFQSLPNLLQAFPQWVPQVKSGTYKARTLSIPLQACPQPGELAQCGRHTKSASSKEPELHLKPGLETFIFCIHDPRSWIM